MRDASHRERRIGLWESHPCRFQVGRKMEDGPEHLIDCMRRLDRALEHLEGFRAAKRDWQASALEYITEAEAGTGWHRFRVKYLEKPPSSFGLLASDYIHQLRSTLDNLVCALAQFNGITPTKDHAFPTVQRSEDWKSAANGRLKGLRQEHIDEIEKVQPFNVSYPPDKHPLAVLDELSRLDKHRLLTPTKVAFAAAQPQVQAQKAGVGIAEIDFQPGQPLSTETIFLRVRVQPDDPDPLLNLVTAPPVYIAFGDRPISEEGFERVGGCVDELIKRPVFAA